MDRIGVNEPVCVRVIFTIFFVRSYYRACVMNIAVVSCIGIWLPVFLGRILHLL